jgi:hypothetical protein
MEMEKTMKPRLFVQEVTLANVTLVIQFLLGMYINLYVEFPSSGPADAWKFAWSSVPVAAHIILGTLGLLATIIMLVRSIILKNRHWMTVAGICVAAMLLAVLGGEFFITTLKEVASFIMAIGFLAALLTLDWGFYTQ